ncbi:unnamed protein product [Clonostachys rhizophaga]|uniref:Pre-rRNA processing protein n=1 Tax=Clonostachys rhizophaga TaxID=160324 RepID=A0A9N9VER3_9HYPO|nr:unnamed protein product [Clonostachys rhizophaga]
MASDERSPLLSSENHQQVDSNATESTPLLGGQQETSGDGQQTEPSTTSPNKKAASSSKQSLRWPSIIASIILAILVVAVLIGGFVVPGAVQQYAEQAAVVEPTSLSVESITSDGVRARIQANFRLDGSKVGDDNARRIGRLATGVMRKLETEETTLSVFLPHYNNSLLGRAVVPALTIDIVDGHTTALDFVTDLSPGDAENIRKIANDWLTGKLEWLKLTGAADITVKSGFIPLGTHSVAETLVFEANKIPSIPEYKIERLNFHDVPLGPGGRKAVGANVSIVVHNDYPIAADVPPLSFDILVANCDVSEPYIEVAEAATSLIEVRPDADVTANALGVIGQIPDSLVRNCPRSNSSPLDMFMKHYLNGEDAEVFVRGKTIVDSDLPAWISDLLKNLVVPIDLPGRSFGNIIRNFSATDVDFKLPSPFADPNDPESSPKVSGNIEVFALLPEELSLDIAVDALRSDADLFFEGKKLGELNLRQWQEAKSTRVEDGGDELLKVTAQIKDVPLKITDDAVFSDVLQKMLFGGRDIILDVEAAVDAKVGTVLGSLTVKGVPAQGQIPVKRLPTDTLNALEPQVDDLRILNTSSTGVYMQASVNFSNPTPYTASIPYFSARILNNGKVIGEAVAKDISLKLGNNTGNIIHATWDPLSFGGPESHENARRLLSDYLSGENTTLEVATHKDSFPGLPELGIAFSKLNFTVPTPRLKLPGDDDEDEDGASHLGFIREATFHLFSSTASFTLASPLHANTVHLEHINATAFYNHTEPVGQIINDKPFPIPPGLSQTPRLPVNWSPDSIGYDKLRDVVGGQLKLDAIAYVTLRIGNWVEEVRYVGHGLGAKVSL